MKNQAIDEIKREKEIKLKNLIYKYIKGKEADEAIKLLNDLKL